MNAIEVNNICKSYGEIQALRDFSFSVAKGSLHGLIGPDGTGKTSMFRILATLILPSSGTASVDGFDVVSGLKHIRQRVGYMPGRFSLYPDLTVEENLRFFATLFGTTIEEGYPIIKDIYGQIERFKNRRAGALSGGMKQKLALSCALIHQPSMLLLDEPTTGVDPVSRTEFWDMLARLKQQDITILVSTPYQEEINRCDDITSPPLPSALTTPHAPQTPNEVHPFYINKECQPQPSNNHPSANNHACKNETIIHVNHLVKTFGTFNAVDDISFDVQRGEIFGFLGANGAGKTTAMRILSGLSKPSSGQATVAGFDVSTQHEAIKRRIGYMSQRFSLYEDLTLTENIRLFGGIYGMKPADIKHETQRLLNKLTLQNEANQLVKTLPLGFKQKLAFMVSILHRPEVVFLDEPTGGVDINTRHQFWQLIYEAAQSGITIFVTTHYMDEAEYCHRLSIMVDGKIRALDTPEALKRQYAKENLGEVFTLLARNAERSE